MMQLSPRNVPRRMSSKPITGLTWSMKFGQNIVTPYLVTFKLSSTSLIQLKVGVASALALAGVMRAPFAFALQRYREGRL
jgi:hypothetical protein